MQVLTLISNFYNRFKLIPLTIQSILLPNNNDSAIIY